MQENEEKKSLTESIEDAVDESVYTLQNAVYGERKNMNEDIPATMETDSGFRRVNKFATRRNLARKIIKNPKILLIFVGIMAIIAVIVAVIR